MYTGDGKSLTIIVCRVMGRFGQLSRVERMGRLRHLYDGGWEDSDNCRAKEGGKDQDNCCVKGVGRFRQLLCEGG